jgi:hypothetical protein
MGHLSDTLHIEASIESVWELATDPLASPTRFARPGSPKSWPIAASTQAGGSEPMRKASRGSIRLATTRGPSGPTTTPSSSPA